MMSKVAEIARLAVSVAPLLALSMGLRTTGASGGEDRAVRLPVTRDTWFSNVGSEADANLGGAPRLKLKSIQEMALIDVDPAPLRGRVIRRATLHVKLGGEPRLRRVTVGSFGADWVEGTAPSYEPQVGSSTHRHRKHPDVPWTVPGSDLCSVILGQGGTTWRMADASPPDADGWQRVPVDPVIVAARVAGLSYGLFLFDDTGSEWTRHGERFSLSVFPNRFVHSRESGASHAPYLVVEQGPEDRQPPGTPADIRVERAGLPAGEALVSWRTPRDEGPAGTSGFFAQVEGREVPRYLIPLAGRPGERVTMPLRDLGLAPGAEVALVLRAVDGAGNIGAEARTTLRVSSEVAPPLPGTMPEVSPLGAVADLPALDGAQVAILDELDKVQPASGALIPEQPEGYLAANHLWSARDRTIRLHAARNEFVAFQILLKGRAKGVEPSLTFDDTKAEVAFGYYHPIATPSGPMPDPIVPVTGPLDVPSADGLASESLHCEVYVPHDAKPGAHRGRLTLKAGGRVLSLNVALQVWDFTLPDSLSFLPEMNCYGLPANERDYYRLAHRHRTVLNRVPYSQNGTVADGCAPGWDGKRLDWTAWDRRFGPYLDGSAFADLPRQGVPIECFYLPMHENWPDPMEGHYNGDYWADRAFSARYRRDLVEVSRQFAEHLHARGWSDTLFQFFLNGKNNFKAQGWSRGSSPWLLDEPANFQDYWALRFFGQAFHEGINKANGPAKLVFRCDISRPQWQRDTLDGLLDYNVVGGAMRSYHRMVFDRKAAQGELVVEYGSTNALDASNMQPVGWCLDGWSLGCDGILPWQTVGTPGSWHQADTLALFYPARDRPDGPPVPSIRLKAYRRGQQDVEYLTLLERQTRGPRRALGPAVREAAGLSARRQGTGAAGEDAGVIDYGRLRPRDAWALRVRVGRVLSEAHPAPERKLVDLRTPRRDLGRLAPAYVSGEERGKPTHRFDSLD